MGDMSDYYFYDDTPCDDVSRDDTLWTTRDGRRIPIAQLEERHLLNCLRAVQGGSVLAGDNGAAVLLAEVLRRGLEPLRPYSCEDEALATSAVSAMYMYWKRLRQEQKDAFVPILREYLFENWVPDTAEVAKTKDHNERGMLCALQSYTEHGFNCSADAQVELAHVFARWTTFAGIAEKMLP